MYQYKLEWKLRPISDDHIKFKFLNPDLLDHNNEGTYTFYVSKGGTKVHITESCPGLARCKDREALQRKDLCNFCFNKLVDFKNH